MGTRLPPLNYLRAFEAAARHLSFRKAADELHVTPAAVSHQVRALEAHLGVQLFLRRSRAVELTDAARACLAHLSEGFAALGETATLLRTYAGHESLSVKVAPSFAMKWLVPRIGRFVSAHPAMDVRVAASMRLVDRLKDEGAPGTEEGGSATDGADIAIRFGTGEYPGFRSDKLFSVVVTPMCAPRLLEDGHPLREPDDLLHHTLLHDDTLDIDDGRSKWESWFSAAGVEGADLTRGLHFNHAALALDAAVDGAGVVLSYPLLASSDLAAGRLVMPFDLAVPLNLAYYVVYVAATADRPKIALFKEWLFEEASASAERGKVLA